MLSGTARAVANTLAQIPPGLTESIASRDDFLYRSVFGGNRYRVTVEALSFSEHVRRILFGIVIWLVIGLTLAASQACIPLGLDVWSGGSAGELSDRGNLVHSGLFMLNAALLGLTGMAFGVPGHSKSAITNATLFITVVVELICFSFALTCGMSEEMVPWFESGFAVALFGTWTCCVLEYHWRRSHETRETVAHHPQRSVSFVLPTESSSWPPSSSLKETLSLTRDPGRPNSFEFNSTLGESISNPYIRTIPESIGHAYAMATRAHSFRVGAREYLNSRFHLRRRPMIQLVLVLIYKIGLVVVYQVCVQFTSIFIDLTSRGDNPAIIFLSFVAFQVVFGTLQILFKLLGFSIDKGKIGSSSFYYMGEVFLMLSYSIFYRNLFSLVESWPEFVALNLVHCSYEWMKYVFRSTKTWYDVWQGRGSLSGDMTLEEWQSIVSLEYGLRLMTSLYSIVSYVVILILLRNLTYNSAFYRFSADRFTETQFKLVITFCLLSGVCEICNAWAVQKFFYGPIKLDFTQRVVNLMAGSRMRLYVVLSVWITCTNAMVAQLNKGSVTGSQQNVVKCFV